MIRLGVILLFLAASATAADTYSIAGVVHNDSGRPVKRVRVAIANITDRENQSAVMTGEDGRFRFDGLPAGKFQLSAEPAGGVGQPFGTRSLSAGFGTAVATGPGLTSDNLVFTLIRPAAITGRVLDADGEPAENILVQLLTSRIARGKRVVMAWRWAYTDDRGVYRFGAIADGAYYVAAAGQPWYTRLVREENPSLARMSYPVTFYPNARDARSAQLLRVSPGQEFRADFDLIATPASKLTVTASGAPAGTQVRIEVMQGEPGGLRCWERVATAYSTRPLDVTGLHPGAYTVRARASAGNTALQATARVTMGSGDTTLDLPLVPLPSVTGTVRILDAASLPDTLFIELGNDAEGIRARAPVAPDGSFHIDAIPPGFYRPYAGSANHVIGLRTVKLNGALAGDEMIEVTSSAKLELTALVKGATVRGTVTRNGQPVEGALVLLAPARPSNNPLDYLGFQTDSDGSYDFSALPAGDVVLIVREDWLDFEYANPVAVRPYLETGRALHLEDKQSQTVDIELK